MFGKRALGHWPQAIVEEVGLAAQHWQSAHRAAERAGLTAQRWASSPQRLNRYMHELLTAHLLSASKR